MKRRPLYPLLVSVLLAACATSYGPGKLRAGLTEAEVVADLGPTTGRHVRPEGGDRLEFARGPFGRHTFMVDMGPDGKVERWKQVMREDEFNQIVPGMSTKELLYRLGRPSNVIGIWRDASVWSYRYDSIPFCLWFRVTIEPDGQSVRDSGYGPDPTCEVGDRGTR